MTDTFPAADEGRDVVDVGAGYWLVERPDIDVSGKAITGRIIRLGEMIVSAMNERMSKFGIRYSHYAIVATLRAIGKPYRMSPGQLQNTLLITSGGVSNLVRKVEEAGYVRRLVDPTDGRGVIVELTEAGIALADETMPAQAALECALVDMFSPEEREILVRLLRRMLILNGAAGY